MERLAADPHYFANPDRTLFADIRRYFPINVQAQVAWSVNQGVRAAVEFIEEQIESGAFEGGIAHCHATTRKGKPCQRTRCPNAITARRTSIWIARRAKSPPDRQIVGFWTLCRVPFASGRLANGDEPRHRQADPPALAGRLPDGGAAAR